jgi:hypothetical protein
MELHRHPAVAAGAPRRCFKRKVTAGTGRGFLELLVVCRELRLPLAHQPRQLVEIRRHAAGLEARASTRWSAPLTNCRKSMRRTIG